MILLGVFLDSWINDMARGGGARPAGLGFLPLRPIFTHLVPEMIYVKKLVELVSVVSHNSDLA